MYYIRSRISRQSIANEFRIIDSKVGDDHRSKAENPMVHALSGHWSFGKSILDLKQSSLRRVRSSNLKLASWRAELVRDFARHETIQTAVLAQWIDSRQRRHCRLRTSIEEVVAPCATHVRALHFAWKIWFMSS